MKRPSAILAEDEPHLRDELRDALASLWPALDVAGVADDGVEALRLLESCAPDILFLDIQMPGLTGLEVAARASGRCHVVFVTAYDQHAIDAFEQGAVDYVLKPFSMSRLATTVSRLKSNLDARPAHLDGLLQSLGQLRVSSKTHLRWINASSGADIRLITIDEVLYFQADNRLTLVITANHESVIRKPIRELLDELDPELFWQINRGTVVNVGAIEKVHRTMTGKLELRLKRRPEPLQVSATFAHLFRQM
jgi:DNA-binding LytR/AlgR family response regulator